MQKRYIFAGAALLGALYIYLFYRTDLTIAQQLVMHIINACDYQSIKSGVTTTLTLPKWAIYNLPGALWVFAATLLTPTTQHSRQVCHLPYALLFFFCVVGIEMVQYFHLTHGIFDVLDIFFAFIAYGFATAILLHQNSHYPTQNYGGMWAKLIFWGCFAIIYLGYAPQ